MGLTIPEMTQALFPIASGAAQLAANGSAQAGFATLLDAFFSGAKGEGAAPSADATDALPLPAQAEAHEGETATATDPFAAFVSLVSFTPVPAITLPQAAATTPASVLAEGSVTAAIRGGATPGADAPGVPGVPPSAVPHPGPAAELLTKLTGVLREIIGALPVLPGMPTPGVKYHNSVIELPQDYRAPVEPEFFPGATPPTEAAGEAAPPKAAAPPPSSAPPPTGPPPTEADLPGTHAAQPATSPVTNRVVRIDGNAIQGQAASAAPLPPTEASGARAAARPATTDAGATGPAPAPQPATSSATSLVTETPESAPVRPIALPEAVRQLGRAIVEQVTRGGGDTHIRLDPPELGSVTISVRHYGSHVEVDVAVERPDAAQLLNDHKGDLSAIFERQGLGLEVQVGVGSDQHRGAREQAAEGRRGAHGERGEFAALMGIEAEPPAIQQRLRAAYNPDGIHIYRI